MDEHKAEGEARGRNDRVKAARLALLSECHQAVSQGPEILELGASMIRAA
jgi:hypothetical protein